MQTAKQCVVQFLPPKVQRLFCKDVEGTFLELDPTSLLSLRELGFEHPGPHEIWLQCDLLDKLQGGNAGMLARQCLAMAFGKRWCDEVLAEMTLQYWDVQNPSRVSSRAAACAAVLCFGISLSL